MASINRLLSALPMRGIRADVGTKSGPVGGARAVVDLEPAEEFEAVDAVPAWVWIRWGVHDLPDIVPMCFENIVIGIQNELRQLLGPELPAMRVVVREVLPHPVEANEMNNRAAGKRVIRAAFRQLATRHTLTTAEVDLAYDVHGPLPAPDGRPPLFMIGHPMTADAFATLSAIFADRTVITYDPRGLGRSERRDGRVDHRSCVQARDLHALVEALAAGPVDMFASSGGAVAALALVAAHPGDVRTLVAHEPPLISVLPDAAAAGRARAAVRDDYATGGFGAGMAAYVAMTTWQGEFTDDYFSQPGLSPRRFGAPWDDGKRDDPLLSDRSWPVGDHRLDIEALTAAPTRVIIATSEDTRATLAGRAAVATAALLGQEATIFPAQPLDLIGYWFEHDGDSAAFGARIRAALD